MAFYIKNKEGQILTSGGSVELGSHLSIDDGVLNADGGSEITVDTELKTDSTNPVQNQVITQRLQEIDLVTAAALNDLNDKKADKDELAQVAFTGDYNDLENKPAIPEEFVQQQVDWNATSGVTSIKNKPNLATVATSGNYTDLESKPNLAAVATSGSYNDLSDKPEVAQSDWNESDSSSPAFIKNKPAKLGGIDNIKVNGVKGNTPTEEDGEIIAPVNITGANIPVTGLTESTATNEGLEINATTDNVNIALGKLQKALKDDEAAITRAFLAVENATGFNNNLEYVPEESTTILGNAKSLQDADAILMNNLTQLSSDFNTVKNNQIRFSGGTSDLVKFNEIPQGGAYNISIPYEGNCTNITWRFPVANYVSGQQYWTKAAIIGYLETELLPPLIYTGRIITFEVSSKNWEWWQYVGPMSDGIISHNDWLDNTNWKQLNISYVAQA